MANPRTLGGYELGERIATGGMAEIFHATRRGAAGFTREICIKQIQQQFSGDPEFRRMFENEALIAGSIQHPNVVQVHDYDHDGDIYYIAMEYVFGKDLRTVQNRAAMHGEHIPWALAARICLDTARGLAAAHRLVDKEGRPLPVIHRDVSPHNILLSFSGEVKIADFGIARLRESERGTRVGVIKGKPNYMSPEQASNRELDVRSDVFSLGIVLWELLSGTRLFDAGSEQVILDMVREAVIPRPAAPPRCVPGDLEAIALRALERSPDERYDDAGRMADALTRVLHGSTHDVDEASVEKFLARLYPDERRPSARARTEIIAPDAQAPPSTPVPVPAAAGPLEPTHTVTATVARRGRAVAAGAVTIAVLAIAIAAGTHFTNGPPPSTPVAMRTAAAGGATEPPVAPSKEQAQTGAACDPSDPTAACPNPTAEAAVERAPAAAAGKKAAAARPAERAAPRLGALTINANPWADVYLKGRKIGTTPLTNHPLPEGEHRLILKNPELGVQKEISVKISAGETARPSVDLGAR